MPKGQRTKQNGQIETSTGNQTVMQRSSRYSPDFNDIEHKWAQAKAYRRKTGKTTGEIFTDTTWNQN